ncbi:MAG: hypothetical protein KU37_07025 [Sulfuricurvum sp. PC08-66]|nr:MAG: hypothetical protein KU37_07025 [Sulfuricurvum sp. PC08-66]
MRSFILLFILLATHAWAEWSPWGNIPVMTDKVYIENCTECHFGYQAGLLNAPTWEKMLQVEELENHFGTDASIDEADRIHLIEFLKSNSAETLWNKKSRKIASSMGDKVILRISEVPYIKKKHEDVKESLFTQEKVKSRAHCNRCHEGAAKGLFEEDDVLIPNHGRWQD